MHLILTDTEARVLGCLIEKDMSTPDYYPLTLNAVVNACNQKSNRDPIMSLDEATVQSALDGLAKKHLAVPKSSSGSRVPKYGHRLSNPLTQTLDFSKGEQAVLCELLLRGPQTIGELRTHAGRLIDLADLGQVEAILKQLTERAEGPFVTELPRQPGRRESRYAHLMCGVPVVTAVATADEAVTSVVDAARVDRVSVIERELAALRAELEQVKQQLASMLSRSE